MAFPEMSSVFTATDTKREDSADFEPDSSAHAPPARASLDGSQRGAGSGHDGGDLALGGGGGRPQPASLQRPPGASPAVSGACFQ